MGSAARIQRRWSPARRTQDKVAYYIESAFVNRKREARVCHDKHYYPIPLNRLPILLIDFRNRCSRHQDGLPFNRCSGNEVNKSKTHLPVWEIRIIVEVYGSCGDLEGDCDKTASESNEKDGKKPPVNLPTTPDGLLVVKEGVSSRGPVLIA